MKGRRNQRIAMIPMMKATRDRIAFAMHAAAETLVLAPSSAAATEAARQLAILTAAVDFVAGTGDLRKSATWAAIESALSAMERIEKRHDEIGTWCVPTRDATALRAAAAQFDHVLRLIPYNVYQAAEIYIAEAMTPAAPPLQANAGPTRPDDRIHRLIDALPLPVTK